MRIRRRPSRADAQSSYDKDWDAYADLVDARKESPEWALLRRVRETHWREFSHIEPGDAVLDAGCGHGDYTKLLLEGGAKVWAFDYSPRMVSAATRRVERFGLAPEAMTVHNVLDIPYPDESFDHVLCLAVIDHIPKADQHRAVRELARVLKPGGTLYINTPNRRSYHWRAGHFLMRLIGRFPHGKIWWFTPRELQDLVRDEGLVPERSLGLEMLPPFSGLYTTDLRRYTPFPEFLVRWLDRLYLAVEVRLRRVRFLQQFCLHYFVAARKPGSSGTG